MSSGPAVTADGLVVGINVATRRGGQLVSFLVPARFAAALLQRVREHEMTPDLHAEIARQLAAWQSGLYKSFGGEGFRSTTVGPYRAPETMAPWFDCWAQTNAGALPRGLCQRRTGVGPPAAQSDLVRAGLSRIRGAL